MKLNRSLVKSAIDIIVVAGVGKIVGDIIKNNTDPEGIVDAVTYRAGTFALGGMIAAVTSEYTDKKIDAIADWLDKAKSETTEDSK